MAILKPSQRLLSAKQNLLSFKRQYRDRLVTLREGRESIFWKALKTNLDMISKGSMGQVENALGDKNSGDAQVEWARAKLLYGAKQVADELIAEVEQTDEYIAKADFEIDTLKNEIKEIEEQKELFAEEAING